MSPDHTFTSGRTLVLLLNWNGWRDTIECLESVYRLTCVEFQVVVCDNDSQDGSLDRIEDWAAGRICAKATNPVLEELTCPPIPKPLPTRRFDNLQHAIETSFDKPDLILIQTGANLGFAGGNNCGIRYFLAHQEFTHVWLLNNDTVVEASALCAMLNVMVNNASLGLVGSQLRSYYKPDQVQAQGGKFYSPWTARVRANLDCSPTRPLDYVDGASMLVSRAFLEQAGLMDERYFLYCEELSWAQTARRFNFAQSFATHSIVFHKEGASAGSSKEAALRSLTAEHYLTRSRILFTRHHHPWAIPTVTVWLLLTTIRAALRRDWKRIFVILNAIMEGMRVNVL